MKEQCNDRVADKAYVSPFCEEIPIGTEGPLCVSNETVGETDGEW